MLIAVIIPAFNAERYLSESIEGVLAQTLTAWQLVVVDDGSRDATAAVACRHAERDSRLRVVRQANRGLAAARNRGLAESSPAAEGVIFLDADDVWEPDAMAALAGALRSHPQAVAASGLSRLVDAEGRPFWPGELEMWGRHRRGVVGRRLVDWPLDRPTTLGVLAYRNCIGTPGQTLIRRSVLEATGGFDARTAPCEDWDMWLRLSLRGEIAFLDRVLLNYRSHAGNMSKDLARMASGQAAVRNKLLHGLEMTPAQRRTVRSANFYHTIQAVTERLRGARNSLAQGRVQAFWRLLGQSAACSLSCIRGTPVP